MTSLKYILAIVFAAVYVCFGYFLERENFQHIALLFGIGFILFFFFIVITKDKKETDILLWISMGFRIIFIVAIPCLSDDYFRFLWDGKLFINGFNPYLYIPSEIINTDVAKTAGLTQEIYQGLNSPEYYTVYPPINQLIFSIGGFFSKFGMLFGIIAIRIPILIAEFFTIKYIRKLLNSLQLPHHHVLWYALNPLVIVELSGNLHFEGMMLLCIIVGIYWLMQNKWAGAAIWWAMAISIKLIPVLFLPVLLKQLGLAKSVWFYIITALALIFTFLPFLDEQLVHHILSSINLYFQTFEFNASIYYVIRWIGFKQVGYNIIQQVGPILSIITFVLVMMVYFYKNNTWQDVLKKMLFAYTIYLLLATTVHPWYIINLVLLSVFVKNYRYAIVWSALAILSYAAYANETNQENHWLIAIEYTLVIGWLIYELAMRKKLSQN
ncbi:MAG: mannosyltransferase [Flavobacteriales bacterium]|nr:MAG: mannosyltransferase [Flavobacteriales bacterium]